MPTVGLICRFLRIIAGDKALLDMIVEMQENREYPYKEIKSIRNDWNRICNEQGQVDYQRYHFNSENSIFNVVKWYFLKLEKDFHLPQCIRKTLFQFCENVYSELRDEEECNDNLSCLETKQYIFIIFLKMLETYHSDCFEIKNCLLNYMKSPVSYKEIFDKVITKQQITRGAWIKRLEIAYGENSKNCSFQKTIENAYAKEINPSWEYFCHIYKMCSDEIKLPLIIHYMKNQILCALQECFAITYSEILNFLEDVQHEKQAGDILAKYLVYMKNFQGKEILLENIQRIWKEHAYKRGQCESIYEEINTKIPSLSPFFVPWLKAYVAVASNDMKTASKLFQEAFKHYNLASIFLAQFVKMAYAFEIYVSVDWKNIGKVTAETDNRKTPLSINAKRYYSFGYAIGLFTKKPNETFLEYFYAVRNFMKYFPPNCFIEDNILLENQYQQEQGFFRVEQNNYDSNKAYIKLSQLTDRNALLSIHDISPFNLLDRENEREKRLYSPLALCFIAGRTDSRLLDIAESWLNDTEHPIDVDKICFNGSTALEEALNSYKILVYHSNVSDLHLRYKKLILLLIQKVRTIGETKKEKKVHILEEGINTYDVEIVRAISQKIGDVSSLIITADECTPLYYAIRRKNALLLGPQKYCQLERCIQWKNLAVEGYTKHDKESALQEYLSAMSEDDWIEHFYDFFGGRQNSKQLLASLDVIISYLIEQTTDVDAYRKNLSEDEDADSWCTCLLLSAESDDVETCEKLIAKGANYKDPFGYFLKGKTRVPHSFVYRLIYFKSWKMLEVLLTKYAAGIAAILRDNATDITPFEFFIRQQLEQDPEAQNVSFFKHYTELFHIAECVQ